jgi:hypothetical protein
MNDENIKRYFLGKLSKREANRLEIEVAENEELFELAEIVEVEMIDDFLEESLTLSEKRSFEKHYLTTIARYEKLLFANLFLDGLRRRWNL